MAFLVGAQRLRPVPGLLGLTSNHGGPHGVGRAQRVPARVLSELFRFSTGLPDRAIAEPLKSEAI